MYSDLCWAHRHSPVRRPFELCAVRALRRRTPCLLRRSPPTSLLRFLVFSGDLPQRTCHFLPSPASVAAYFFLPSRPLRSISPSARSPPWSASQICSVGSASLHLRILVFCSVLYGFLFPFLAVHASFASFLFCVVLLPRSVASHRSPWHIDLLLRRAFRAWSLLCFFSTFP